MLPKVRIFNLSISHPACQIAISLILCNPVKPTLETKQDNQHLANNYIIAYQDLPLQWNVWTAAQIGLSKVILANGKKTYKLLMPVRKKIFMNFITIFPIICHLSWLFCTYIPMMKLLGLQWSLKMSDRCSWHLHRFWTLNVALFFTCFVALLFHSTQTTNLFIDELFVSASDIAQNLLLLACHPIQPVLAGMVLSPVTIDKIKGFISLCKYVPNIFPFFYDRN